MDDLVLGCANAAPDLSGLAGGFCNILDRRMNRRNGESLG